MRRSLGTAIAAAGLSAAAVAGCGFGPGEVSEGEATMTVTRDYGSERLLEVTVEDPRESESVLRLLDREAEIETRYGGAFVQSIEGLPGTVDGGRSYDWFFYVNGIESSVGAAEVEVHPGDRVWWDYRDWTDAMRVPAVVGSWPQPFGPDRDDLGSEHLPASGKPSAGSGSLPAPEVRLECLGRRAPCEEVSERLEAALETELRSADPGPEASRVLVGPWARVRGDEAVRGLGAPEETGVFATFKGPIRGEYHLVALAPDARPAVDLGPDAGLVAALRADEDPPTWVVTGPRTPGVQAAAELLDEGTLRDRYAVARKPGGEPVPLPVPEEETG